MEDPFPNHTVSSRLQFFYTTQYHNQYSKARVQKQVLALKRSDIFGKWAKKINFESFHFSIGQKKAKTCVKTKHFVQQCSNGDQREFLPFAGMILHLW